VRGRAKVRGVDRSAWTHGSGHACHEHDTHIGLARKRPKQWPNHPGSRRAARIAAADRSRTERYDFCPFAGAVGRGRWWRAEPVRRAPWKNRGGPPRHGIETKTTAPFAFDPRARSTAPEFAVSDASFLPPRRPPPSPCVLPWPSSSARAARYFYTSSLACSFAKPTLPSGADIRRPEKLPSTSASTHTRSVVNIPPHPTSTAVVFHILASRVLCSRAKLSKRWRCASAPPRRPSSPGPAAPGGGWPRRRRPLRGGERRAAGERWCWRARRPRRRRGQGGGRGAG
jgi:hypothetical protein